MPEISKHSHGAPSWADLSTTDEGGALAFYSALFGWEDQPNEIGENWFYHIQKVNGLDAAAIFLQSEEERGMAIPPRWNTYFTISDADAVAEKARALGGEVLFGPMDVFEHGRSVCIQDPQGAVFMAWEPWDHIGARVKFEPGSLTWHELMTTDSEAAIAFYTGLLGLERGATMSPMDYKMLKAGGTEVLGVMQITPDMGDFPPYWEVYFAVADVDATVAKARSLGGSVMVEPTDIPDVGRFAILFDPQGAVFSIFKAS